MSWLQSFASREMNAAKSSGDRDGAHCFLPVLAAVLWAVVAAIAGLTADSSPATRSGRGWLEQVNDQNQDIKKER